MEFTNYKTDFSVQLPSARNEELVKSYKIVISKTKVKAYTLNDKLEIVEGLGWIESDGSWNYHNNYDNSEDVMWFEEGKTKTNGRYFTQSLDTIQDIRKENINRVKKELNKILNSLS